MPEHVTFRWLVKALTPPIVVIGVKGLLRRLGLLRPAPPAPPVADAELPIAPPEFEALERGWDGVESGWDTGTVADAYLAKWPDWVAALEGPKPLGVYHEARAGDPLSNEDIAAHNMVVSFAYVIARAARNRECVSVLDWGGGFGHYAILARAVVPGVEFAWHCREIPSVAAAGAAANPDVTFHTDETCLERRYDLVVASGSLQYAQDWAGLLGGLARATSGLLLVTRLPIAREVESFVVLQRAAAYGYGTDYAGWVLARDEFLDEAAAAGLVLDRELLLDAWMSPAGARETPIGHRGFLFRPAAGQEAAGGGASPSQ